MRWRRRLLVIALVLIAGTGTVLLIPPGGPRSLRVFDPDRIADLEVDMWKAYYDKQNLRLFTDLVTSLHEQNRYPWGKAGVAAFHLARAAATFATATGEYERVLPDLEAAYTTTKEWTGAGFDAAAVARAELAWWVARRVPGQDSPEQVGRLIANESALLYEVPRNRVLAASILRARAGKLRDIGGDHADWATVSDLLHQSYRQLHEAVQPQSTQRAPPRDGFQGSPVFEAFSANVLYFRLDEALDSFTPAVRAAIEARLGSQRAFKSTVTVPTTKDLSERYLWEQRRGIEAGLVVLASRPGGESEAAAYAKTAVWMGAWEGYPDGPMAQASHVDTYLREHPQTALVPYLELFLLTRYRCAFEAAGRTIVEYSRPQANDFERRAIDDMHQIQRTAAESYKSTWERVQQSNDVVVRAIAEDIDEQRYLYANIGQHPR
jgi:hypothetical protein